jgi:hypothetical protein
MSQCNSSSHHLRTISERSTRRNSGWSDRMLSQSE